MMDLFQGESTRLGQEQERLFESLSQLKDQNAKLPKAEAKEIKPIYGDPNKNLTNEEISSLFDAYGK